MVEQPLGIHVIKSKWIFKNKTNDKGNIICNKARLVALRYTEGEGVDYDETFPHGACIELVRLLTYISCTLHFTLHQLNVKIVFLNAYIQEKSMCARQKILKILLIHLMSISLIKPCMV